MGTQNKWKYCKIATNQHPLCVSDKSCIELINAVCIAEGAKKTQFATEVCLNLDKLEGKFAQKDKRNARKTMDISFGVSSGNEQRTVLCEFRLNYKNVNNLKKSELDSKILNSKSIVGHSPLIYTPYIFVFNSKVKNQALRTLRRLYSNRNNTIAFDLNELKAIYFN